MLACGLSLVLLPWLSMHSPYTLVLAIDLLTAVLFAASLHFIMGPGGMHSFGHAAYFGLGAYGAALAAGRLGLPMEAALLVAPCAGALGAWVERLFVRTSAAYDRAALALREDALGALLAAFQALRDDPQSLGELGESLGEVRQKIPQELWCDADGVAYDSPELLREALDKKSWHPQAVAMSGITDVYQPIERRLGLTRKCLEVFAEFRNPVGIVTKNHLVTRDIDLLRELARFNAVNVSISITTLDAELSEGLEFVSSTSPTPARVSGKSVSWTLGALKPGQELNFTIVCKGTAAGERDGNRLRVMDTSRFTNGAIATDFEWRLLAPTPAEWDIPKTAEGCPPASSNPTSLVIQWTIRRFGGENLIRLQGAEAGRRIPPVVTGRRLGVKIGAGTDAHRVASYNPFTALQWFLDGKTVAGTPLRGPEETPDRLTALELYTLGSAWFSFDDDVRGSLEVGKLADLAVLTGDYLTVPLDEIGNLESVLTMLGGKVVYAAGELAAFQK